MKNIYIVDTPYHLLISTVKTLLAHREGMDAVLIMKDVIPLNFQKNAQSVFRDVDNSYNRYNILLNVFLLKLQQCSISIVSKFAKKIKIKLLDFFKDSDVYIFDDTFYFGCWLNNSRTKYNLIEDALNYYCFPKKKTILMKKYDYLYRIMGISWDCWGKSKYTKSIEVNENKNLCISHNNIIVQNREQMFKKLTPKQIEIIAHIFDYKPLKNIVSGDKTLLLTQPLSEDSLVSHETKIHIYKHLVDKHAIGKLYIKIHPREKEDYTKTFPDAIILGDQDIPFEVYQLKENFHFKKAITVFSTAIKSVFCADEKISMSPEWMMNFSNKS
ncbi:MAG: hypothetical protein IJ905_10980 [Fibrobacter sp.]|nr:hypothetical protein [Fibrobacter sp.]